jgi:hypothetical protein
MILHVLIAMVAGWLQRHYMYLHTISKHPHATLWPSEVVTLGILHTLKGVGNRAFYRWLTRDYRGLFPHLPERTRLFRLFSPHQAWTAAFLATPTVLGASTPMASSSSYSQTRLASCPLDCQF